LSAINHKPFMGGRLTSFWPDRALQVWKVFVVYENRLLRGVVPWNAMNMPVEVYESIATWHLTRTIMNGGINRSVRIRGKNSGSGNNGNGGNKLFGLGTDDETVLEFTEAVLVSDLRRKVYNAEGRLNDPYAHYLCRSKAYRICRRWVKAPDKRKSVRDFIEKKCRNVLIIFS